MRKISQGMLEEEIKIIKLIERASSVCQVQNLLRQNFLYSLRFTCNPEISLKKKEQTPEDGGFKECTLNKHHIHHTHNSISS